MRRPRILAFTIGLFLVAPQFLSAQSANQSPATALLQELKAYPHQIVFESYANDNWDLFVINADGSNRRNLTQTPDKHELYPQTSPDGTKICFLEDIETGKDTVRSVCLMNSDGTDRRQIAEKSRQPCWSPDGKTIAFLPQEFSTFRISDFASKGLVFYDLATGEIRQHPHSDIHHLYNPSWSADGKWIVSTVHGGMGYKHAILAIEVDGTRVFDLGIGGCRPCISPDGNQIAWGSNDHTISIGNLHLSDSGASVSEIRKAAFDKTLHLYHVDFSPDGRYITFSVGPGGRMPAKGPGTHTHIAEVVGVRAPWDLFVARASGDGIRARLTQDEELSNKESDWIRVDSAR